MRVCVYCKNRYQKGNGITFHKFPSGLTKQLWLKNMKMENWNPRPHDHLCSEHFTKDCFNHHASRLSLAYGSVPTIFVDPPPQKSITENVPVIQVEEENIAKLPYDVEDYIQTSHLVNKRRSETVQEEQPTIFFKNTDNLLVSKDPLKEEYVENEAETEFDNPNTFVPDDDDEDTLDAPSHDPIPSPEPPTKRKNEKTIYSTQLTDREEKIATRLYAYIKNTLVQPPPDFGVVSAITAEIMMVESSTIRTLILNTETAKIKRKPIISNVQCIHVLIPPQRIRNKYNRDKNKNNTSRSHGDSYSNSRNIVSKSKETRTDDDLDTYAGHSNTTHDHPYSKINNLTIINDSKPITSQINPSDIKTENIYEDNTFDISINDTCKEEITDVDDSIDIKLENMYDDDITFDEMNCEDINNLSENVMTDIPSLQSSSRRAVRMPSHLRDYAVGPIAKKIKN